MPEYIEGDLCIIPRHRRFDELAKHSKGQRRHDYNLHTKIRPSGGKIYGKALYSSKVSGFTADVVSTKPIKMDKPIA